MLCHVVNGQLNKQIAHDLGTAEKTIKIHRGRMMRKMKVKSVAALVRMTDQANRLDDHFDRAMRGRLPDTAKNMNHPSGAQSNPTTRENAA